MNELVAFTNNNLDHYISDFPKYIQYGKLLALVKHFITNKKFTESSEVLVFLENLEQLSVRELLQIQLVKVDVLQGLGKIKKAYKLCNKLTLYLNENNNDSNDDNDGLFDITNKSLYTIGNFVRPLNVRLRTSIDIK